MGKSHHQNFEMGFRQKDLTKDKILISILLIFTNKLCMINPSVVGSISMIYMTSQLCWRAAHLTGHDQDGLDGGWRIPGDWVPKSWLREAGAGVGSPHSGASCRLLRAPSAHSLAGDSNQLLGVNVDKKFLLKVTMNWGSGVGEDGDNYPQHNTKLKLINQQFFSLGLFSIWKIIKLKTRIFRHWCLDLWNVSSSKHCICYLCSSSPPQTNDTVSIIRIICPLLFPHFTCVHPLSGLITNEFCWLDRCMHSACPQPGAFFLFRDKKSQFNCWCVHV